MEIDLTTTGRRGGAGQLRLLVAGSGLSGIGDGVFAAAAPLLVASHTDSAVLVAGILAAHRAPWLLASLHGGALVDRSDLSRLLPRIDLARAIALLIMTAAVATGTAVIPVAYVVAFLVGLGDTTVASGLQAAVPRMVADDRLQGANTAMFMSQSLTEHLSGPALGGLLFAVTAAVPFGVDAATFVLAAGLMSRSLPTGAVPKAHATPAAALTGQVSEAVRWIRDHVALRRLTVVTGVLSAAQAGVLAVLVLLVQDTYGAAPSAFGLVLAAGAVGNLAGAAVSKRLSAHLSIRSIFLVGGVAAGMAYLTMGVSRSIVVACLAMAVEGCAVGLAFVVGLTYRQRLTPSAMLGRVSAAFRLVVFGVMPVGAVIAGVSAQLTGPAVTIAGIGIAQTVACLVLAPRLLSDRAS